MMYDIVGHMQYRVISADNHILEPPTLFIDRVPARYRDQAPRIVRGKDGGDGWSLDGSIPESTVGLPWGLGAVNPGARIRIAPRGLRWEELVPGNYDGAAHIKDMASDGIDAAVVYPQMVYRAYTGLADRDLGLECLKAFNDWLLEDFVSVDPKRLIGMCMIPWEHSLEVTTAELERVLKKGARAIFLPYTMNPPIHAPYWDPIWELITGANAVASVHLRFGGTRPPDPPLPDGLKKNWLGSVNIVMGYFSATQPLTEMIYTGLFERFPELKFVHAEVDWGWLGFWTEIMDQVVRQHNYWVDWPMRDTPQSYIGKNVFVTGLDDVEGFRLARAGNELIAKGAMFSIDYPHEITLFGSTQKILAELTDGLDPTVKHAILAGTAMKLYNLGEASAARQPGRETITVG
jgi:predicted TIM-barrel fold metal-dependent hydrolase